jgi:hypothetical protein
MLTSGFWPRCAPVLRAPVFLVAVTSKMGRYASLLPFYPPKIYVRDSNPGRPCDELSTIKKNMFPPGIELKFLNFFLFCGLFLPAWIRILIPNTDTDPLT